MKLFYGAWCLVFFGFLSLSCSVFIGNKYKATNYKKLNRVYLIEDEDQTKVFKTKEAWLEYCNSRNPWGTTQ
jgi:hypothetical protein